MITSRQTKTRNLIFCALFSALTAIGAFIQVPVPFMDYFTLQFLFVTLAGLLLGPKRGAVSVAVYVAVGLAGFPVFAAGGGPQYIFRPSFGYLVGFIAAAFVAGVVARKARTCSFRTNLIAAFSGMLVTYAIGFLYKFAILNLYMGQPTPLSVVVLSAFPLDIPGDAVLCVVAAGLANRLRTALKGVGLDD